MRGSVFPRCLPLLSRLKQDSNGATIVEFGIIILPMCLLLLGGLDLAYQSYVTAVTQGALNEAARTAAVRDPTFNSQGDTIEEQVENEMRDILGTVAVDADINVGLKSYFDFSGVGNPERLVRDVGADGTYDESDGDCFEDANNNGQYDLDRGSGGRGGASDVVFYTAEISMPRLLPWHKFVDISSRMDIVVKTAVRSQPYGSQPTPPVICGDVT